MPVPRSSILQAIYQPAYWEDWIKYKIQISLWPLAIAKNWKLSSHIDRANSYTFFVILKAIWDKESFIRVIPKNGEKIGRWGLGRGMGVLKGGGMVEENDPCHWW